jgi:hypothetical protein
MPLWKTLTPSEGRDRIPALFPKSPIVFGKTPHPPSPVEHPIGVKLSNFRSGPEGAPWVAAGFNLRLAEPNGPFNPDRVDRGKGWPLQGRIFCSPSVSVGFTYGYSRCPASRERRRRIIGRLILTPIVRPPLPWERGRQAEGAPRIASIGNEGALRR